MDTADQKLEVIRKLLAKAERAATAAEADAYNTKAAEMMARHGVDAAMVESASGEVHDRIGSRRIGMTDPYSREKALLANGVASAMGCRTVLHPGVARGQIEALTVMGFESDLRRVEVVFTSLLLQATKAVVRQRPPSWSGGVYDSVPPDVDGRLLVGGLPKGGCGGAGSGARARQSDRAGWAAISRAGRGRPAFAGRPGIRR